jgi:hypothetical protein
LCKKNHLIQFRPKPAKKELECIHMASPTLLIRHTAPCSTVQEYSSLIIYWTNGSFSNQVNLLFTPEIENKLGQAQQDVDEAAEMAVRARRYAQWPRLKTHTFVNMESFARALPALKKLIKAALALSCSLHFNKVQPHLAGRLGPARHLAQVPAARRRAVAVQQRDAGAGGDHRPRTSASISWTPISSAARTLLIFKPF